VAVAVTVAVVAVATVAVAAAMVAASAHRRATAAANRPVPGRKARAPKVRAAAGHHRGSALQSADAFAARKPGSGTQAPMATAGTATRVALLAGATGLIGRSLLPLLLADARYSAVHVLLRRAVVGTAGMAPHPKLTLHPVDFARLQLSATPFPAADDVFIALGTTIKVAGSEAAFRQVDFDFVVNTARAARDAGAARLAVVSALGADAHSRVFYNRVKGDMQAAVGALGYGSVVLAQPSLLVGDRAALGQPVRAGEVWATRLLGPFMGLVPKGVRPIQASAVAKAMLAASFEARPGIRILSSAQMQGSGQP